MPLTPEHHAAIKKFTSTDHKGRPLNQKALLHPNPMIARVIAARAATLSDDERAALKSILNPQTAPAIQKLLPELSTILNKGNANGG